MDLFGIFWLVILCVSSLFGYRVIFSVLVVTSIFQSTSIINSGQLNVPLFYFVEIVLIIRFCFPDKRSGFVSFNNSVFIQVLGLILFFWIYSYLSSVFFSGMKVYSTRYSFEYNFYSSGTPLLWSGSNINQLALLTLNLVTSYMIYIRRQHLSAIFAINSITFTATIFSLYSLLWILYRPLAEVIQTIMYNSSHNANAVFESRLSGTFGEPSFAGVFIGALIVPLLSKKGYFYKFLSLLMCFFLIKNGSSSGFFTLVVSIIAFSMFYREWSLVKKMVGILSLTLIVGLTLVSLQDVIISYVSDKSASTSGIVRQASNDNAIGIILHTFGIGIGIGSARISSLMLGILANFGVIGTVLLILYFYNLIKSSSLRMNNTTGDNSKSVIILMLISVFVGSWAANPDYSYAFLWVVVFCSFLSDDIGYKTQKDN